MYNCLDDQSDLLISILKRNKQLMDILDYVCDLGLNNFYIAAGCVFQTIWNYYDGNDLNYGIKDIDIIYYDKSDLSVDKDIYYYELILKFCNSKGYNFSIDVSNEARMHLWKKEHDKIDIDPYISSEDAISKWIATIHAIGITKRDGKVNIYAPYGLSDIFSRTIRPIKHNLNSKELYDKKVSSWSSRFKNVNIIDW